MNLMNNDAIKQLEELEKEVRDLLYNVVGMSYRTQEAMKIQKKIKEIKEEENDEQ